MVYWMKRAEWESINHKSEKTQEHDTAGEYRKDLNRFGFFEVFFVLGC